MTTTETSKLLTLISSTYRREFSNASDADLALQIGLWQKAFADVPYEKVLAAVQSFIFSDTAGFAPVIGKIREILLQEGGMDEAEAWALVSRACQNGLYGAKKEFEKLPPEVQRAVGSWDQIKIWAGMDEEYVQSVVQKQFKKDFRAVAGRQRPEISAPERVRSLIHGIGALPE